MILYTKYMQVQHSTTHNLVLQTSYEFLEKYLTNSQAYIL